MFIFIVCLALCVHQWTKLKKALPVRARYSVGETFTGEALAL